MAEIIFDSVGKVYPNGQRAVTNASFTVPDGSFTVLVGPSGCGKSTLLRMTAGLETISSGSISIEGVRINEVPPKDRDIAMVFQDYALYPHMTVAENMAYALRLRGLARDEIDRRIRNAAEILGLTALLNRKPAQMSGGQRQRVAVGRAIVRHPKAFLFDEPLSNLDAKLRVQMRSELSMLHKRLKATMIYVTHDQVEAMTMGDQIVVLNEGRIQQIDTPMNLYLRPRNRFVAGFIGSPAMNFLEMRLDEDGRTALGRGFSLGCSDALARALARTPEKRGIVGIRPEDLHDRLEWPDAPSDRILTAVAVNVEPLGAEVFVAAAVGEEQITARFRGDFIPETGSRLELVPDFSRIHVFHPETGERIEIPDET
ncbi:MAG: sn-glycerol-3-phosphate ABC transporter ATP-binding protein UgpC [Candidatus Hydrogenedentota bacterium]|nr:MAG: sn-glycerol-3-phosphate ABC transporter ATP-binding protein UgpC [Candidatus Hydrogenedentota bacterium]